MELWIHVDLKCLAPTPAALRNDIAGWADAGATGVVFEWENMFPYPGFEDAVRGDAYTPEDVTEILDCCRSHGLSPVPLVQTFGHVEWFLSHKAHGSLREFPDSAQQIRACDERSWQVLKAWLAALLEAHHDSPYVHLGADEAWGLTKIDRPECSAQREGPSSVFLRHMQPLFDQVLAAGKRPIIWADMLLRHPEEIDRFPKEVVFCDWLYSQTAEYGPDLQVWGTGRFTPDGYDRVSARERQWYEKYWRMDSAKFPGEFYQFPYTPFLRDHGFDTISAPATLYAANSFAGTNVPKARANERGWLGAARRFGGLGALNTCWAVRGALRETSRTGHRAFLIQGAAIDNMPADHEVSVACWQHLAQDRAAEVAEAVDGLAPAVNVFSKSAPTEFDTGFGTHRPVHFDRRLDMYRENLAAVEDDDPAVAEHQDARERAARTEAALADLAESSEEAEAWLLGARESGIRAELWLAARDQARGAKGEIDLDGLAASVRRQSAHMADFMTERYQPGEVQVVREDRYHSTIRLIRRLGE